MPCFAFVRNDAVELKPCLDRAPIRMVKSMQRINILTQSLLLGRFFCESMKILDKVFTELFGVFIIIDKLLLYGKFQLSFGGHACNYEQCEP